MTLAEGNDEVYDPRNTDHVIARLRECQSNLDHVARGILFNLLESSRLEVVITRNFLAKSTMLVRSIYQLWPTRAYQECHILYRSLLDRLFYLDHLYRTDGFQAYDDWSFARQYDLLARWRNDTRFQGQDKPHTMPSPEERDRRRQLRKSPSHWSIPSAAQIAHKMNRDYLYLYGYDHGSMNVHPLANDGLQDFETLTRLKSGVSYPEQTQVLRNAVLVLWLLISDTLDYVSITRKQLLATYLDNIFEEIESGTYDYWDAYNNLMALFKRRVSWFTLKDHLK